MSCSILSLTLTILYMRWYINVSDLHDIHILSLFMEYWLNSAIWVRHRWSRDLDVTSLSGTTLNQYIQLKWTLTVLGKVLTWVNLLFLSYHNSVCFLKFLFYLIINKLTIIFFCFRYIIFFSFIVIFVTLVLYVLNTLLRFIFRRIGPACAVLNPSVTIVY